MKGPRWGWYLLIGVAVLVPVGVRLLTWLGSRRQAHVPTMVQAGETLFHHEWKPNDPLAGGDGLGPVYNATSCVACHHQGGPGGAGGVEHNVTTFVVTKVESREGVVHAHAVNSPPDTLRHVNPELPEISQPLLSMLVARSGEIIFFHEGVHLSQRNTTALFGANLIDALPDHILIANESQQRMKWGLASAKSEDVPVGRATRPLGHWHEKRCTSRSEDLPIGRAARLADGRIGRFGWKAQSASLSAFVQAACANELGLGNPGQAQPRPLSKPNYEPTALDLTAEQCDQITAFVASLPRPMERQSNDSFPRDEESAGKQLFHRIGCADCHMPNVGGVEGLYSDLLLHDMGQNLVGGGSYNNRPPQKRDSSPGESPQPGEWRTPPLWGVADSAPNLHDGRASTLDEAIKLHGGQAAKSVRNFDALRPSERHWLMAFLYTLRAP